eukprot:TRINITY_DN25647_c0_g1_i1.p1 TRINITY_DN25647_c0_g1~~TRINITY_DN25647_c0_g1_i1.p1  ORF type:complete len:812 (+),score=218.47 TRINITY_DN25647_c0_g1_i1:125-2560(+)
MDSPRAGQAAASAASEALPIGTRVRWLGQDTRPSGVVLFSGPTDFATGHWIGVALDTPLGRNSGTVEGRTYFSCPPQCGIFVRRKKLELDTAPPARPSDRAAAADQRPQALRHGPREEKHMQHLGLTSKAADQKEKLRFSINEAMEDHDLPALRELIDRAVEAGFEEDELKHARNMLEYLEYEVHTGNNNSPRSGSDFQHFEDMVEKLREDMQAELQRVSEETRRLLADARREMAAEFEDQLKRALSSVSTAAPAAAAAPEKKQATKKGGAPPLGEVNWQATTPPPKEYLSRRTEVKETHRRAIQLQQLFDLGDFTQRVLAENEIFDPAPPEFNVGRITWDNTNLYHMNDLFVMPLTKPDTCSFVELVAPGPQEPKWFISHWWGTRFKETSHILRYHATEHENPLDTPYWMCTFANNQHNLGELEEPDLLSTPFVRAIMMPSCVGTIMLMDKDATPFSRAWCVLENFVTTTVGKKKKGQLLEIGAIIPAGSQELALDEAEIELVPECAALLVEEDDGNFGEFVEHKGAWFPPLVSTRALAVDVCEAKVSMESDKRNILRLIAGIGDSSVDPPKKHPKYDSFNRTVHEVFAPRGLLSATMDGNYERMKVILESGMCGADVWDADNCTPCYLAASHNRVDCLRLLLENRADVNIETLDGVTPLSIAVQQKNLESVQFLLESGADVHVAADNEATPAFWACAVNAIEELKLLLQYDADPNDAEDDGTTCLHAAAEDDHDEIVQILLDAEADPDKTDSNGDTPLSKARAFGATKVIDILVGIGAAEGNPTNGMTASKSKSRMSILQLAERRHLKH